MTARKTTARKAPGKAKAPAIDKTKENDKPAGDDQKTDTPANPPAVPASNEKQAEETSIETPTVHVRSMRDGHRRGGRAWTRQVEEVAIDALTDEQWCQVLNDQDMVVLDGAGVLYSEEVFEDVD